MKRTDKQHIDEFNFEEARWWVLDRFISIERTIDFIIMAYINSEKANFVRDVLLNSSIINFWSKIKLLKNISKEKNIEIKDKNLWSDLHELCNLRNAFAHCEWNYHINVRLSKEKSDPAEVTLNEMFSIVSNNWEIKNEKISDALNRFCSLQDKMKDRINKLL